MADLTRSLLPVLALAALGAACSGDPRTFVPDNPGQGGGAGSGGSSADGGTTNGGTGGSSAGDGGSAGSSAGGSAGDGGAAGSAGSGGAPPTQGQPGFATVNGGMLLRGNMYKAWVATGESPSYNGVSTSTRYRLHGGVVGTSQP